MSQPQAVVLIPAWNEADRIGPVVQAARRHLPVLVVDDGSADGTGRAAEAAGALVLRHEHNQGKGGALRSGFAWVLGRAYDAALTLDADGQHDPDEIPHFLHAWSVDGGDLVIGKRDFSRMPFPRGWINPIGSRLLSLALRHPIPDNQSGYRLYARRLIKALDLASRGFEFEVEAITQALCLGFEVRWIDIRTIYGTGKASYFHPLKDTFRFLWMVGRAYRKRRGAGGARDKRGQT
ncbi:MAG: glycosyltransferase family 2 protein [Anaerolineales bacterium]